MLRSHNVQCGRGRCSTRFGECYPATLALDACLLPQGPSPPRQDGPIGGSPSFASRHRLDSAGDKILLVAMPQGRARFQFRQCRLRPRAAETGLPQRRRLERHAEPRCCCPSLVRSISETTGRSRRWFRRQLARVDFGYAGGCGSNPPAAGTVTQPARCG